MTLQLQLIQITLRIGRKTNYLACGGFVPIPIGIPSGAGTCGTVADAYVPTNPSIRMEILIMCFMGFLLPRRWFSQTGINDAEENYKAQVKPLYINSLTWFTVDVAVRRCG